MPPPAVDSKSPFVGLSTSSSRSLETACQLVNPFCREHTAHQEGQGHPPSCPHLGNRGSGVGVSGEWSGHVRGSGVGGVRGVEWEVSGEWSGRCQGNGVGGVRGVELVVLG